MARKIVNRRELREQAEAAEHEAAEQEAEEYEDEDDEHEAEEPTDAEVEAVKKPPKKPAKRKSRSKTAKEVRLKAFWGVFNQSLRRVAIYDYSDRRGADAKAEELTGTQRTPHFVKLVKEVIEE